jgi:hypothetical protein
MEKMAKERLEMLYLEAERDQWKIDFKRERNIAESWKHASAQWKMEYYHLEEQLAQARNYSLISMERLNEVQKLVGGRDFAETMDRIEVLISLFKDMFDLEDDNV